MTTPQHTQHEAHDHQHHIDDPAQPNGNGGHGGHDKHAGHDPEVFRQLFWWNLVLAVPVLVFSKQIQDWFDYSIDGAWSAWIAPVVGTVIFLWGGKPFLAGGVAEVRNRQPGMMLLISLAITVAYGSSLASSFGWGDLDFWWELAALIVVMLLGHWQEMKAIGQAQGALAALAELLPDTAERVSGNSVQEVAIADLAVDDVVLVRPVTGESRPVTRSDGDRVVAGTVSTNSSVRVRIDAVGDDTALAGIHRLVADAQSSQSRVQALADRAAAALFYLATTAAIITFVAWLLVGNAAEGVIRTVTVLVIACPHALGLAIPLVISISTATSARAGILVKNRLALERMRTVDAVLFDKTGTLTKGNHAVVDHAAARGWDRDLVLAQAAGVEADSEHPIARAIVAAEHLDASEPDELAATIEQWRRTGGSVLYVFNDGAAVGALTLADEIRPESRIAVDALHQRGKQVVLITGDAQQVADGVAAQLGIDEVFAGVLPQDKDSKVAELQARGLTVAMVGDGVNDAPALARANVGIAIGAGTDVAVESAGVVLASSDPRGVTGIIDLSTATYAKMIQNLVWATAYNLIAIPIAAGAFAFAGLSLPPAAAAVAMSASTIIVAANAQLLRRLDLRPEPLANAEPTGAPAAAT